LRHPLQPRDQAHTNYMVMKRSHKDDPERDKETKMFDPFLFSDERVQDPVPAEQEAEDVERKTLSDAERDEEKNREKTEVISKEAMLRITSGLI
jgi:CRISPR/Cas system CMR-associated protein Cmr3 (group 5 of RAMP superfamily)